MSLAVAEARAEVLRQQLNQASHAYYVLAQPILLDEEYDRLYEELVELETLYPQLVRPHSPTQRVGEPVTAGLQTITHPIPLLSLENISDDGMAGWEQQLHNKLHNWERQLHEKLNRSPAQPLSYVCELKVDGVALALRYEQGLLVQGATRGDGHQGEEITASVRTVRAIPLRLQCPEPPPWAEIRGEAFFSEATFSAINQQRRQQGQELFANARNACAGTLRQLDPQVVANRMVDFLAYQLHLPPDHAKPSQQLESLNWLKVAGFKVDPQRQHCGTLMEVEQFYHRWKLQRHLLPYGTDGVVVKLNDLALQRQVGHTQRAPSWARAIKPPQPMAKTRLQHLVIQVGRTGVVTPVAAFDPVVLEGSTVARATLHNEGRITTLTGGTGLLHAGDQLVVRKAGGIIPEVVAVQPCPAPEVSFAFPSHCPECASLLVREPKGAALHQWLDHPANQQLLASCPTLKVSLLEALAGLEQEAASRCVNSSCPAIFRGSLRHWASRDALDIDGLGSERIEQLVEQGLVHTIDELYGLQEAQLTALAGWAKPLASSLLQALESSKQRPWHRVLYGLGIPHVGITNAKVLAHAFPSAHQLMEAFAATGQFQGADEALLAALPGIGKTSALKLQQWLSHGSNQKVLIEQEKQKHWSLALCEIPDVGPERAEVLANAFPSAQQLMDAFAATRRFQGADELLLRIGKTLALKVQRWLADPANQKVLVDLEASGSQPWHFVLGTILEVDGKRAKVLAEAFPSAEQLMGAFSATHQWQWADEPLKGIGREVALSLQQWLADVSNQKLLKALTQAGLQTQTINSAPPQGPLTGQTFVITGSLVSFSRVEAQRRIEAAGGAVASSVSKKITHLVVGADPGSKLDKARALGVEVLDETTFLQRLAAQKPQY